jgi:hypothetical protein
MGVTVRGQAVAVRVGEVGGAVGGMVAEAIPGFVAGVFAQPVAKSKTIVTRTKRIISLAMIPPP